MAEVPTLARGPRAHVALFDSQSLLGKGVKEQLASRGFPIASVHLYTSRDDPDSNLTEFAGAAAFVSQPDIDALGPLDIAFFCGTRPEGARYLDWPRRKGFVAIDLTAASRAAAGVPLVNAATNPEAIPAGPGLVASPHPIALMLSTVIAAVRQGCGLVGGSFVVLQPVSDLGEEGIDELYQETIGLMNFKEKGKRLLGRQVAFNLIPDFLLGSSGRPDGTLAPEIEAEIAHVVGGTLDLAVSVVLAPVFHCHAVMARLVLPPGKGREDLEDALGGAEGISLLAGDEPATPVERAGEPGIVAGGLRPAGAPGAFWLWLVSDNLQSGAALNAVRIAEALWRRRAAH